MNFGMVQVMYSFQLQYFPGHIKNGNARQRFGRRNKNVVLKRIGPDSQVIRKLNFACISCGTFQFYGFDFNLSVSYFPKLPVIDIYSLICLISSNLTD